MTNEDWDYFGRDSPHGITELYRAPRSVADGFQKFAVMERLRKGGVWVDASSDSALKNDWASGWFDFDENRMTGEEVEDLARTWSKLPVWPGRP